MVVNKELITSPKTPKSIRVVPIPDKLAECLDEYMGLCYGLKPADRIFPYKKEYLYRVLKKICEKAGVKKIRVHDVRHPDVKQAIKIIGIFKRYCRGKWLNENNKGASCTSIHVHQHKHPGGKSPVKLKSF